MNKILRGFIVILLLASIGLSQTAFVGITPGKSSKTDAERILGRPVTSLSDTLFEYREKTRDQKVYVQYRPQNDVVDRVEAIFDSPMARDGLAYMLALPDRQDLSKYDKNGRVEEYFGGQRLIVLTHASSEVTSPVIRVGYYSK